MTKTWPCASRNFLECHRYTQGGNAFAPEQYHFWSALSLLAAVLQRRVWTELIEGNPLYPNLYVLLVGVSSIGKGVAVRGVQRLVPESIPHYPGSTSRAALFDRMATSQKRARAQAAGGPDRAKLYITFEEFGESVPPGAMGEDLLRLITHLWDNPQKYTHDVRMHGARMLIEPTINLLGGSTRRWLKESVPSWTIEGGFLARVMVTEATGWAPPPTPPPRIAGYQTVCTYLQWHAEQLATLTGPVTWSDRAQQRLDAFRVQWSELIGRTPDEHALRGFYGREWAAAHKLAIGLAAAEPLRGSGLHVMGHHVEYAITLLREMRPSVEALIRYLNTTPQNEPERVVQSEIEALGVTTLSDLIARPRVRALGLTRVLIREIIMTLVAASVVEEITGAGAGVGTIWRAKRRRVPQAMRNGN